MLIPINGQQKIGNGSGEDLRHKGGVKPNGSKNKYILLTTAYINEIETLKSFIKHVASLPIPVGWQLHLVIADNSGTWPDDLETPDFCLVFKPGANLGYLGGCRYALTKWLDQYLQWPDFYGIVNNDITFQTEFFVKLANLPVPEDVAIIAPDTLRTEDGLRENPFLSSRLHPYQVLKLRAIYSNRITGAGYEIAHLLRRRLVYKLNHFFPKDNKAENMETIYAPAGSAMFIRPVFFERGGSLAFKGFLFEEEIFLAEEAARLELKVLLIHGLTIIHDEHTSLKKIKFARKIKWIQDSLKIIWEDYYRK